MNELDTKLYELFSKKELSEGCLLSTENGERKWDEYFLVGDESLYRESRRGNEPYLFSKTFEILGHEPQLHDVFRVAKEKDFVGTNLYYSSQGEYILWIIRRYEYDIPVKYNPTLPLLEQSDETKTQIISLFS